MGKTSKRRMIIIFILVLIAAIHILRVGSYLEGVWLNLYYGYFSDFILPFGGYFLLCAAEQQMPFLRQWKVRWGIAFLVPAIAETSQYFGIPVLGSTFDPVDYWLYALGATLALVVETRLFPRLFPFWNMEEAGK